MPSADINRLLEIMAALRTPGTGCPWDLEQNFSTIVPYTIEEAYEVADAITRDDLVDLKDELGDLLLQVVFHARLAEEIGAFTFDEVVEAISAKMVRRHPHVFGAARQLPTAAVNQIWRDIKAEEKRRRRCERAAAGIADPPAAGALDGVPTALPALTRAFKLQAKAGAVGFDWNDARLVLAKIQEEADEVEAALNHGDQAAVQGEIGDLLFAMANLARHVGADPEAALRGTNAKFERRFAFIEAALAKQGRQPSEATLEEMDALWNAAKEEERQAPPDRGPWSPQASLKG